MDKPLFKRIAQGAGLPGPPLAGGVAAAPGKPTARRSSPTSSGSPPTRPDGRLIAKPACLGSSVGMGIAHVAAERAAVVEAALAFDARAIVEPCLDHPRELEMGVLGNPSTGLELFGPGEVIPGHEFYDYADKYAAGSAARTIAVADVARGGRRRGAPDRRGGLRR